MTNRAVGYSRFSTDLQNEKSIADQEALIRKYAGHHGFKITSLYSDAAQSGASILGRDGLLQLLQDAKDGKFDVVVVEELDRLSRDMEDLAGIHKRLSFLGIEIIAVHEGVASTVTVGLRGLVGQLYREDNARKVRRGLTGKVNAGLSAGGRAYGYKPDPLNKGKLLIVEEEAAVVRRIFDLFAAGHSPRAITAMLQAEGAPLPREGTHWSPSVVYGWAERGSGILRNNLYAGKLVWNKVRMIKDPDTGKRISRPNPPSEWQVRDVPELRIVPQELFDKVQEMIKPDKQRTHSDVASRRRPQRMLSGLIKCGACGSGMAVKGKDSTGRVRIECSRHRDNGACPDPQTLYLDRVETAVIETLREELANPRVLVEYVRAYNEARVEFAGKMLKRRACLEKRVSDLDAEIGRIINLIAKGIGDPDRLAQDYGTRCDELKQAKEELAMEPEPVTPVVLHPEALKIYGAELERLAAAVNERSDNGYGDAANEIRHLVHSIIVRRGKGRGEVEVIIKGKLRTMLEQPLTKGGRPFRLLGGTAVAEEGLEPPARGL